MQEKYKLFVLCGKSASGKDTVIKELVEKHNYKRVISYTTRPIRDGEVDGVHYNFVSEGVFKHMIDNGEIIEYNTFDTKHGKWYYGTHIEVIDMLKENNLACIKEPNGTRQLINKLGVENVIPILIERKGRYRLISSLKREPNATDEQVSEMIRRYEADNRDFKCLELEDIYKIENNILENCVNEIHNYIKNGTYKYWICDDLSINDTAKIKNIRDEEKASHLVNYIGKEGKVFSYIIKDGEKRYKVSFGENNDTAYFRRSELKLIKRVGK